MIDKQAFNLALEEIDRTLVVLAADGYLFAAPENLAHLSGLMKEFFDRCYYPVLGRIEGRGLLFILETNGILLGSDEGFARELAGYRDIHVRVSL